MKRSDKRESEKTETTFGGETIASLKRYIKNRKVDAEEDILVFPGYSEKVLISNWFQKTRSLPKDYDAYNPPGGNYFRSTYNRWGQSEGRMISEAKAAQEIFMNELKKPKPRHNPPLLNLVTLRTLNMEDLLTEDSELLSKKPSKYEDNYITTMQRDYINHYPQEPKFIDRAQLYKPETKHRKLLTELAHPRRPGRNKFYDENVEYLNAKKVCEIPPPPWALHYDPRTSVKEKKEEVKGNTQTELKENSNEACVNCD